VKTLIKVVQDIGLLVARLTLGLVLVAHGWQRFTHGVGPTVDTLKQYGLPEPQLFAWGATVLEVIGGALLIFGLLTPIVAAFVVAEQVMVIAWLKVAQRAVAGNERHRVPRGPRRPRADPGRLRRRPYRRGHALPPREEARDHIVGLRLAPGVICIHRQPTASSWAAFTVSCQSV